MRFGAEFSEQSGQVLILLPRLSRREKSLVEYAPDNAGRGGQDGEQGRRLVVDYFGKFVGNQSDDTGHQAGEGGGESLGERLWGGSTKQGNHIDQTSKWLELVKIGVIAGCRETVSERQGWDGVVGDGH